MSTFQAIVLGIIHGFTEFLPLSPDAHHRLIPYLLNWPTLPQALRAAMNSGALLALLVYFRHDWASIFSSFLQTLIYRKKPMTLDERLPVFIVLAGLPSLAVGIYFQEYIDVLFSQPISVAGSFVVFGFLLWLADYFSRRNKGMFDWNWLDSLLTGVTQAFLFIPGCGRTSGALIGAFFRGYQREAAAKVTFFMALPILAAFVFLDGREILFHAEAPADGLTWFTFWTALGVTFFASLMAIGGFMKQIQRKSFLSYFLYRLGLTLAVMAVFWIRSKRM